MSDIAEASGKPNSAPALFDDLKRDLPATLRQVIFVFCVIFSLAHLWFALSAGVAELTRNAIHFAGFAFLCAVLNPISGSESVARSRFWLGFDIVFGLLVAASAIYLALAENAIYDRGVRLNLLDRTATVIVIFGAIELTRRATGLIIPGLIVLALSYAAYWGQYVDGVFRFPGLGVETLMFRSIYGDDAVFGQIARISSTFVFLFIIFGAFLLRSGAGDFVIDLARALAGKMVGGPGLVAVIASGLTGTISGSAVANTASTGVITIPLMKRAGFPAKFAAGVEAAASTGGQLMPPIMGAGAFVMAAYTQISYEKIVAVAALPALLYFASVGFFVRIEAKRQGIAAMGSEDAPSLIEAVKRGGASFIIPITILIGMLVSGFTPTYAAVVGIIAVIASSWLTRTPMGPTAVLDALALGARTMVTTAVLLCAVGLIINIIVTAGIGNAFSLMIAEWSGGNVIVAIILIALASLVLGMGLPVTAAYIVLATLSAPVLANMISDGLLVQALVDGTVPAAASFIVMVENPDAAALMSGPMGPADAQALVDGLSFELKDALRSTALSAEAIGVALLSAHMIIFWLSQDSNVTPPVCLAAFTAAAIAKSPPMATGFTSWKVAKGLYIVPLLFATTPFLSGNWAVAFEIFFFALFGIYALAGALQGWMEGRLNIFWRIAAAAAGIACMWPGMIAAHIAGAVATVAIVWITRQKAGTEEVTAGV